LWEQFAKIAQNWSVTEMAKPAELQHAEAVGRTMDLQIITDNRNRWDLEEVQHYDWLLAYCANEDLRIAHEEAALNQRRAANEEMKRRISRLMTGNRAEDQDHQQQNPALRFIATTLERVHLRGGKELEPITA
jgi:hypothetical protein